MAFGMYPDTILFIVGGFFAVLALVFVVYLIAFRKRSRVYAETLRQETETFDALTTSTAINRSTAVGSAGKSFGTNDLTEILDTNEFDPSVIRESYIIEYEIDGGAMSRTFVVRNKKLDNQWFLKFVSSKYGKLSSEEHILKLLNHVSLPKIVDVFYRAEGTYLIQTLVEGVSLDEIISPSIKLNHIVLEWFEQIAQALNYLHNLKSGAVFHLDLKPANIMVTHDNRLVLIDFGISRRVGDDASNAVTVKYAAPEQFGRLGGRIVQKYADVLHERFGQLPIGFEKWDVDARTDIYSLGVIMYELATGKLPTQKNKNALDNYVSRELSEIIQKCLNVNPDERYKSVGVLLEDLRKVKGAKLKMARVLLVRRFAAMAAVFSLVASAGCFATGYNVFASESAATIFSRPDVINVSLQQSSVFDIVREMPTGQTIQLDSSQIRWQPTGNNIAHIDGNRVTGLNIGSVTIAGNHRNGNILLDVRVVEPMHGIIEISQRYQIGRTVSIFAGTVGNNPARPDGTLATMDFFSPESITATPSGVLYISDAGVIRRIDGNTTETISIPREYIFITADMLRHSGNDLFIKTAPWVNLEERDVYAIARVRNDYLEKIFIADARNTAIEDFAFCTNGRLYFIERNAALGAVFLRSINPNNPNDVSMHYRLPEGSTSLAISNSGAVYIGNTIAGAIQVYLNGELRNFAGLANDRAFIDGSSPRFYSPQRLDYHSGYLYVWDFNTLRRIEANEHVAGEALTIVGIASPEYTRDPSGTHFPAEDITLPHGRLMDFAVTTHEILITDHKRGIVWRVD